MLLFVIIRKLISVNSIKSMVMKNLTAIGINQK